MNPLDRGLADVDRLKATQNAAFGSHSIALLAKRLEFLLKFPQVADALRHVLDVLVKNLVDDMAVFPRRVLESQQRADLIKRHVERAAVPDESKSLQVLSTVDAVVSVTARGLAQQALALIEADGFRLRLGYFREFADLHGKASPAPKCTADP
jgi:hypothetical protein